jgi:cytochrome P450 family 6
MRSAVEYTLKRRLCTFVSVFLPELYKYFDISFTSERFTQFTFNLIPKIIAEREKSGENRCDLIDLIIQLKNGDKNLSTNLLIAQAVSFLFGAYETSSTVICFTLYELAKDQNSQEKLREEILSKSEVSFENIANTCERPFLHQVLNESMRLYSEIPFFDRIYEGHEDYLLDPFSDFKVKSGTPFWIPIYALSHDENFFDDPWTFKPERFENVPENIAHMPFGIGPRSCIGKRFALIQVKTAICKILKSFRVEMSEKSPKSIKIHKRATFIQAEEDIYLNFVKI